MFFSKASLIAMNYAHMIEVIYKHEDSYTNPLGEMKENISMLLAQSIQDWRVTLHGTISDLCSILSLE